MSYQTNSAQVNAQAVLLGAHQSGELRYRMPVTYLELLKNSNVMFPSYEMLRTREDRAVDAKYFSRSARALGSGRSHLHTGAVGASGSLTPSWSTYNDVFTGTLKQGDNNVFSKDEMMRNDFLNVIANMLEGHETLATNYLFNNRSTVNGSTGNEGAFNATQDVYEISEGGVGTRAPQITKGVMNELKYQGNYTFFCDSIAYQKFEYQAFQGSGNSANLSFQFNGITFVNSVEMGALAGGLVAPYADGFWLAVPNGMVGILPWIPKQNREGVETSVNKYFSIINPVDGLNYAVHSYEAKADGTANGGYTQDVVTEYEVSQDLAIEDAPLTNAGETVIQAFAFIA